LLTSANVVANLTDVLDVSVDYLIGKTSLALDKRTLDRIEEISSLPEE
jgi:hypothetical protein